MEKSFDFGALLRNNEKKHKSKPTQFVSVAGGIQKRLETNIKIRKSTRLTSFDQVRNFAIQESPVKSDAQLKIEHRRQQLEKWKEEKEKKKKEAAAQKKKPFIVGAAHAPIKYLPPPAPPKPSISGRVTRSQTAKSSIKPKPTSKQKVSQSFAPKNASFKPPELKNLVELPVLAPPSKTKSRKVSMITFEPVTHKEKVEKQSHSKTAQKTKPVPQMESRSLRTKMTKKATPKNNRTPKIAMSSSSSETEAPKPIKRVQTPGPVKSVAKSTKSIPKVLTLSATEQSNSDSDSNQMKPMNARKPFRDSVQIISVSQLSSDSQSSFEDQLTMKNITDSDKTISDNSDIEFVNNTSLCQNNDSSTTDSGKHSDWEVISGLNKLSNSLSDRNSDVEIVEVPLKNKTPRKSIARKITDSGKQSPVNKRVSRKSLLVSPKNRVVPKSESNSEERLRSPKSPNKSPLTPQQMEVAKKISPCVTLSRGKDNARKEMKWKMSEGLLDVDASDIDSVEQFRHQLKSEKSRMMEMCETWEKISEQTSLPDAVQEAVLSAVGQAKLLMSKKLCQFASLVERCARPEPGVALVTPADLHGFWDMVFMQVENIDMRFKKLEELKEHNWVEKPVEVKKKVVRAARKIAKPAGNSRIKEMIDAARKAKKDQETGPLTEEPPSEPVEKTFEGGFFSVRSPIRSPRPITATPNNKPSMLKAVLSSEAKKASASKQLQKSASYAMLRASLMSKCPKDDAAPVSEQTTPQLTPINLYATPGRSILKSTNKTSTKKSGKKSIKLVLFDDSDLDSSLSTDNMYTAREINSSKIDGVEELTTQDEIEDNTPVVKETKKVLRRQNAREVEDRVVMTRNERRTSRKSLNQPEHEVSETQAKGRVTRSTRKTISTAKVAEDENVELQEKTPRKSARKTKGAENKTPKEKCARVNKKAVTDDSEDLIELRTPKRSSRKKALQEVEVNVPEEQSVSTPKRKSRTRKSAVQQVLT